MKRQLLIYILIVMVISCTKDYRSLVPDINNWDLFSEPAATSLPAATRPAMEGVYKVTDGADAFGGQVAIKWSYVIESGDTTFHMSAFGGQDIAYFICEGKQLNGSILLNGYWRKMVSTATGIVRMTISADSGAMNLLGSQPDTLNRSIIITGYYGDGQLTPSKKITFQFIRPVNKSPHFRIMAHRSGGRNSDQLPVSENSVAMIKKTAEFGSTGIEVDIQLTKDGVPILYHDNNLNLRETQKSGLIGPITDYTYVQLSTFVRLIHGEKIPTLREALDAVLNQTALNFVWLDTKLTHSIETIRNIQKEYLDKAKLKGRDLQIVIGIPATDQLNDFVTLKNYDTIPSLCELSVEDVERLNSKVWAPRFTLGTQNDAVDKIHAEGREAFVWTLDVPDLISQYIDNGHFDAILSNYPSCVAYYYYVHQ